MKNLLATTATIIALSTTAYADAHTNAFMDMTFDAATNLNASELIGMRVYASEADIAGNMIPVGGSAEWDDIGEINEIVLTRDGDVASVIVGVGGFLGLGEKDVAIAMDQLQFVMEEDNDDFFLVVAASQVGVLDAPAYEYNQLTNSMDDDADMEMDGSDTMNEDASNLDDMNDEAQTAVDANNLTDMETEQDAMDDTDSADMDGVMDMDNDGEMDTADVEVDTDQGAMAPERTVFVAPVVVLEGYTTMAMADFNADDLTGANLYSVNDEDIGEVSELLLNADGEIDRAVLDIGGFLGLGEHSIAVSMEELQIMASDDGDDLRVYIDATQEALEAQPEYEG